MVASRVIHARRSRRFVWVQGACAGLISLGCSGPAHPPVFIASVGGSDGVGGDGVGGDQSGVDVGNTGDAGADAGSGDGLSLPAGPAGGPISIGSGGGSTNPGEVYVVGVLKGTSSYAFAPVAAPNQYTYGFPETGQVGFRGAALLYISGGVLKVFNADVSDAANPKGATDPTKNDTVVDTKPCASAYAFLSNAAQRLIYECARGGPWYEGGKQVYDDKYRPIALGENNSGLAYTDTNESGVVNLADGSFSQIADLSGYLGIRQHGTGFHVVVGIGLGLFNIDADGTATSLGSYPAAAQFAHTSTVLGSDDVLYELGDVGTVPTIMRFPPEGAADTVATYAADDALSWIFLLSGP
jgi:hypothetical protein